MTGINGPSIPTYLRGIKRPDGSIVQETVCRGDESPNLPWLLLPYFDTKAYNVMQATPLPSLFLAYHDAGFVLTEILAVQPPWPIGD